MPDDYKAIPLSQGNWQEIGAALGIARPGVLFKPLEPLSDGFFTAAIASIPGEWQRLAIVVFPYSDAAWQRRSLRVLQFEARAWERWCALQESLAPNADGACPPLWWSRGEPRMPAAQDVAVTLDDGLTMSLPSLVRPYIPYPTLRESPIPPIKQAEAIAELRMVAHWIVGDEDVSVILERRGRPDAQAQPPRRPWWRRLLWWRRELGNRFVFPDLVNEDGHANVVQPHQLLTDGRQLIPTRWRIFDSEYSLFGQP